MKKANNLFAFILAIVAVSFFSCEGTGNDESGDWYGGGHIEGETATFTVEFDAPESWETSVVRINAAIGDWFTFSPTKGNAGKQKVTFIVSTKYLEDLAEIQFTPDDYVRIYSEDGLSELSIQSRYVTSLDISTWTQLYELHFEKTSEFYFEGGNPVPNLKEIWMKQGQRTEILSYEITPTWTVKYK